MKCKRTAETEENRKRKKKKKLEEESIDNNEGLFSDSNGVETMPIETIIENVSNHSHNCNLPCIQTDNYLQYCYCNCKVG